MILARSLASELAASSLVRNACVTTVDNIESGGADNGIELVNLTLGSFDAVWCEFGDGVLLDINDTNVVAVELLVVPSVTQRPPGIEFSRMKLPSFLWVLDCLADLFHDGLGNTFVRLLVHHMSPEV